MSVRPEQSVPVGLGNQLAPAPFSMEGTNTLAMRGDPQSRNLCFSMESVLKQFCSNQEVSIWSPTESTCNSIFKNTQFDSLSGSTKMVGDTKAAIVHDIILTESQNTSSFPVGLNITNVDEQFYSRTGKSFARILLPNSTNTSPIVLQENNVDVAYAFNEQFPGYTAENVSTKGVHPVNDRRFYLVDTVSALYSPSIVPPPIPPLPHPQTHTHRIHFCQGHPIMVAIKENEGKLQVDANDFTNVQDGLCKVGSQLMDHLMPQVKDQIASQVRVRNLGKLSVKATPSNFESWTAVRASMLNTEKLRLNTMSAHDTRAAQGDAEKLEAIKTKYESLSVAAEAKIDNTPISISGTLKFTYNVMLGPRTFTALSLSLSLPFPRPSSHLLSHLLFCSSWMELQLPERTSYLLSDNF